MLLFSARAPVAVLSSAKKSGKRGGRKKTFGWFHKTGTSDRLRGSEERQKQHADSWQVPLNIVNAERSAILQG